MDGKKQSRIFLMIFMIVLGILISLPPCMAYGEDKADDKDKPDRLIVMAAEYTGVEVPTEEDVSMDIIFKNKGRSDETVEVWISDKPKNWKARLKTYRYTVMGLYVPSDESKTITLEAQPDKGVEPGEYMFRVEAKTPDEKFKMAQDITIRVKAKEEGEKVEKGVKLTTSYPVLRGPSDAKFEFSVEVESKLGVGTTFRVLLPTISGGKLADYGQE